MGSEMEVGPIRSYDGFRPHGGKDSGLLRRSWKLEDRSLTVQNLYMKLSIVGLFFLICVQAQAQDSAAVERLQPLKQTSEVSSPLSAMHGDEAVKTLDELYAKTNSKIVAMEVADDMLKQVRRISLADLNDEQGDKLMKVYRAVSAVYADNVR